MTTNQWIGLRENLQETMVFTIKYRGFLKIFPSSNSMNEESNDTSKIQEEPVKKNGVPT
jgi:hypothetical protein